MNYAALVQKFIAAGSIKPAAAALPPRAPSRRKAKTPKKTMTPEQRKKEALKRYRARRDRLSAQGCTVRGTPRKRLPNGSVPKSHTAYVRFWRQRRKQPTPIAA